jgi:hypothetical protein
VKVAAGPVPFRIEITAAPAPAIVPAVAPKVALVRFAGITTCDGTLTTLLLLVIDTA